MNMEQHYAGFKLVMRHLNVRNELEATYALKNLLRVQRLMFWICVPSVFLSLILIPLFGVGLLLLPISGFMLFRFGKQIKRYKTLGEKYVAERGWEDNSASVFMAAA